MFLSFAAAAAADYPRLTVKVVPIEVSPRVYYVQGAPGVASTANEAFNSNAGFVITDDGVVVVDALGSPALGAALLKAIRAITDKPVRRVIVTHYHADHFYGLGPLKAAGAQVWAQALGRAYLEDGDARDRLEQRARDLYPWVDAKTPIVAPDRWIERDESFVMGHVRFELMHFGPAHSPEDLVIALPQQGVIFSGDILFAGRIPFVGEADSKSWLAKIEALLQLKPRVMVTGHGAVSRDPARDLALTRDYLRFLREAMGRAVEELTPFDEAYRSTDWSRFARMPAFDAANRINAYGQYLLMERELLKR